VALNAAQSGPTTSGSKLNAQGKWEIEVLYSIYDTRTHRVNMPFDPSNGSTHDGNRGSRKRQRIRRDFTELAVQIARTLQTRRGAFARAERPSAHRGRNFLSVTDHSGPEAGEH